MKVTALIDDRLVEDVRRLTGAPTLTAALKVALEEWVQQQAIGHLTMLVEEKPLHFRPGYDAEEMRETNRRRSCRDSAPQK